MTRHDLAHIKSEHEYVNRRCEEWARWVRVTHRPFGTQPMFRGYMSKARQWETEPTIPVTINTLAAHEVERAVAGLPDENRRVLRWCYVWPALHINAVAREIGTDVAGLSVMRDYGLELIKRVLDASKCCDQNKTVL